jgi:NitT/TauT family transport system substrate-binding protein
MLKHLAAALLVAAAGTATAEQVVVSNYGVTTNGMPFAVAMEKGFFKEFKAEVDGVLSSDGGGTTIRNLLGGRLAYGEAAVSAIVSAVQSGADLRIISGNVHTVAEFVWVSR